MAFIAKTLLVTAILVSVSKVEGRPPVQSNVGQGEPLQPETNDTSDWNLGLEYNRYLQEVVQVLESDPDFRKKLETADVNKIRDGSIANELELVGHQIRTQLDVIKRRELERLRHLAMQQYELKNGIDKKHIKIPDHLELKHPTFEVSDLKKLIKATTKDLEEADKKRREEFKKYEMEKKFEQDQRLQHIEDEQNRKAEEQRMKELEKKHRDHGKVNHPLTKDQLEEVWESQDQMRPEDWDPKTFFAMHDLNGDQYWDEDEVRVLFKKELDKVYDPNAPEDDMREREEEMERMREHAFRESDTNKDRLISFQEFLAETHRDEFEKDPGWETMDQDNEDPFTDEEFRAYEMQRLREIQGMIDRGIVPPGYPYFGAPGAPIHPQYAVPGQPMHPGLGPQHGGPQMNIQPLRGEQQYMQPGPQYGGAQPHQQFAPVGAQPQFGGGQPQQFGAPPRQQFGQPQQQVGQGAQSQQQFGQPVQPQQQYAQPVQSQQQPGPAGQPQQQFRQPAQPQQPPAAQQQFVPQQQVNPQGQVPQAQPVDNAQAAQYSPQDKIPEAQQPVQPQPRGQPVLRAQKSAEKNL